MEIVDPRGTLPAASPLRLAARPKADGPIGFLINETNRGMGPDFTTYSEVMEEELRRRRPTLVVERQWKPVLSRPAGDEMLAHFRDCSGVVSGLAK